MIVIVDYGVGNVGSVLNMFRKIDAKVCISSTPILIEAIYKFLLLGIGHFSNWMSKLAATGLIPALEGQVLSRSKPILGIFLGLETARTNKFPLLWNCLQDQSI